MDGWMQGQRGIVTACMANLFMRIHQPENHNCFTLFTAWVYHQGHRNH